MTLTGDAAPVAPATDRSPDPPPLLGPAALAAIVVGVTAAALYRQGAFYPLDAFGLAVVAVPLVVVSLTRSHDRYGIAATVTVGGLALWWFIRALTERSSVAFLPLGASLLSFLAAFLIVRALGDRDRSRVAAAVAAIGAVTAALGMAGVLVRWHPLAQQAGDVWRMSTTLTYPAGAAVLFIMALLMGTALDLRAPLPRAAVCLSLAGLVATQSHWELLALAGGVWFVPFRRWTAAAWPLTMGWAAGLVVVVASTGHRPTWIPCVAVAAAVVASMAAARSPRPDRGHRWAGIAIVIVAVVTVGAVIHPPVGHRPGQPTDQGQTLAWSTSVQSWRSSVLTGVGPPRMESVGDPVDTYPGFAPDSYLTVIAESGLIGAVLLVGAGAVVVAATRRRDLVSSCAAGATVAFAVSGFVDFAWQLPALALLGGCMAGLASGRPEPASVTPVPGDGGWTTTSGRRGRGPGRAVSAWVVAVVAVIGVQLVAGTDQPAGGVSRVGTAPPRPTATPARPGRIILRGHEDATDPFMLTTGGRYYLYTSEGTTFMNVPLRIGSRPGYWGPPVDVLPHLPSWAQGGLTWAPDVHRVAGGWALYFTALLQGVVPYTHCIGSAFAASPSGPFVPTDRPFVCQRDHRGSIDGRVFVEPDGHLVLLWKSEDNANPTVPGPDQDGDTGIYAQGLSADGRTLLGSPVKILGPSQPWEGTIVEAPDMIEASGTYWLFFSGNWYYSTEYGVGVAACQSPLGPCSDPDPEPFLGSNAQGAGPGEASLFRDGSNAYLLYNPFRADDPGPVIPRPVAMARLGFTARGPYLAAP